MRGQRCRRRRRPTKEKIAANDDTSEVAITKLSSRVSYLASFILKSKPLVLVQPQITAPDSKSSVCSPLFVYSSKEIPFPPLQKQCSITKLGCEIFDFFLQNYREKRKRNCTSDGAHTFRSCRAAHEC